MTLYALLLWTLLTSATNPDCLEFKTGTFSLKDDTTGADHLIERTETIQTETDLRTGTQSKFKVTWVNECEYELNIMEGREEVMEFFKDRTLTVQITKTRKNGYSFNSFIKGTDRIVSHDVKRVKQ